MRQITLASQGSFEKFGRKSKREQFLETMEGTVPWSAFEALIEPHYPKAGNGRQPVGLSIMLRTYFLQQWFNLSDPGVEDAFYESATLRRFAGVDLGRAAAPDETTILRFRHLLEEHDLCGQMLDTVNLYLERQGVRIGTGTIVDATIIAAPSSTKNSSGERDPEMHQTRKGKQWYFGAKAHIGVDARQGHVHSVCTSAASVSDVHMLPDLLHGGEKKVWGDGGYWLAHYGFEPALVESAPRLRTGGYVIDFWGAGFEIADRMGLLPEIRSKGYMVREVSVVNRDGQKVAGFPAEAFFRMTHGRYVSLPRGELAATIFSRINGKVETIFGDSVDRIEQTGNGVHVGFTSGSTREFDLVVGADGLHSRVRELVFGPKNQFEKYLGFKAATFGTSGYRPRDEPVYVMYTQVGQPVARFAMRDDRTMFLFTFADEYPGDPGDVQGQKALLRKRFEGSGWDCAQILAALDAADDFYFDRVSQIRMDPQQGLWTRGRVTLIGDAASCVSLLAGQGTALAMVAAYILAGELSRCGGDYAAAFRRYQELFGPFVLAKQKAALRFAGSFAPKSELSLFLRNQIFRLMAIRWIADLAVGRDLADHITLPAYR